MKEKLETILADLKHMEVQSGELDDGLACFWLIRSARQSLYQVSLYLIRYERNPQTLSPADVIAVEERAR